MVKTKLHIVLLIALAFSSIVFLQDKVKKNKDQLNQLKWEIKSLETELNKKSKAEKENSALLDNYNKQNYLLDKLITNLKSEEELTDKEINEALFNLEKLNYKIGALKTNYAKYVLYTYKYGRFDELAVFFDAENINQAVQRFKYLKILSQKRYEDLNNLNNALVSIQQLTGELKEDKYYKEQLVSQKESEEKLLTKKLQERKRILAELKNDKAEIKKQLITKRNAEEKIKNMIGRLIDKEKRNKVAENSANLQKAKISKKNDSKTKQVAAAKKDTKKTENELEFDNSAVKFSSGVSLTSLKGRINWPLSGKIIHRFGENRNEQLNTVTMNYGVDILASSDANVRVVSEGVVSVIDYIVGFGSVIIITHKDGYRTVYSHLSNIYVKEGSTVKAGQSIGRAAEGIEGNVLHFEIWKERSNQNPEHWLARK